MSYDAVVVGAGFAGLSAAVRLTTRGARVLVLEAHSHLGGRATSFVERETAELVDNGQHALLGCYRETFAFLREIGAADRVRLQPQLAVTLIDRSGARSRLVCPNLPGPLHLLAGLLEWEALTWRDRLAALDMAKPLRTARRALAPGYTKIAASPGETVEKWLLRNGQTPRIREMLWDPLALAALNQPAGEAAAPPFARVLAEMFASDAQASAIALANRPLQQMYAEPARAWLEERGGSVRTGCPATVRIERDRILSVDAGTDRWSVPVVISAVPWFAFPGLVEGDTAGLAGTIEAARAMKPSPIVTVYLWFDRSFMADPFIGLPGRPMQWLFDNRAVVGAAASYVSLVSSGQSPIVRLPTNELVATARQELVDVLPEARDARLLHGAVRREPRATFSLAPGGPKRPLTATGVRGLYLAGDWIDTGLPATVESAVRSGHAAAEAATRSGT